MTIVSFVFRSSPVHIFGNSNSLHSYARPPLASSAPNPSRGHLRERRRVRVTSHFCKTSSSSVIFTGSVIVLKQTPTLKSSLTQFVCFCIIYNRPAANQSLGFSPCPHPSLMMKTWPGLTPGPPPPGIASLKVLQSPSQVPFSLMMFLRNLLTEPCRWTASVLPSYSVLTISRQTIKACFRQKL